MTLKLFMPDAWISADLPSIALLNMGQSPSSSDVNDEGNGIVFFQGKAEFGKLHPVARKYCTAPKKIAEKDDILLSVRAPVGPTNVADQTTAIGRGLAAVRPFDGMSKKYVLHYFRSIEPWLSEQGTGSTFKAISGQFLKSLPVAVPPLAEQKKIAAKLDELLAQVDGIKTRLDAIPAILKRFRQSILAAAVSGRLTEEWRVDHGVIPWIERPLSDYEIEIQIGPFGSLLHKSDYISDGVPLVNPMHIVEGKIKTSSSMSVTREKSLELERYKLNKGDIVLGRRGEMGRAAVVFNEDVICGTGSLFLRPNIEQHNPHFLRMFLASPDIVKFLESGSVGSTMTNLNQKILKNMQIPNVSLREQNEIVGRVDQLFSFADQIEQRVKEAQSRVNQLTQSILAKAFRGELTVEWREQNPDLISGENSAEALLEKIKAERAANKPAKTTRKRKAATK